MRLYHYTNEANLKKIIPSFFGKNYYTKNDVSACAVKRSFFYTEKRIAEISLQGTKFCYIAEVKASGIYDIQKDKKEFLTKYSTITEALKAISKKYTGIIYSYNDYKIVSLFVDIPGQRLAV